MRLFKLDTNSSSSHHRRADIEYSVQLQKRVMHKKESAPSSSGGLSSSSAAAAHAPMTEAAAATLVVDMAEWNGCVPLKETRFQHGPAERSDENSKYLPGGASGLQGKPDD